MRAASVSSVRTSCLRTSDTARGGERFVEQRLVIIREELPCRRELDGCGWGRGVCLGALEQLWKTALGEIHCCRDGKVLFGRLRWGCHRACTGSIWIGWIGVFGSRHVHGWRYSGKVWGVTVRWCAGHHGPGRRWSTGMITLLGNIATHHVRILVVVSREHHRIRPLRRAI